MSLEKRVNDLFGSLGARERIRLSLRAIQRGEETPKEVYRNLTPDTRQEINRLLTILEESGELEAASTLPAVAMLVSVLPIVAVAQMRILELEACVSAMGSYLRFTKGPVTEAELEQMLAEARQRLSRLQDVAEIEAYFHRKWSPEDLDEDGNPSKAAYRRVKAEKLRELKQLVKEGIMEGVETEKGLCIRGTDWEKLWGKRYLSGVDLWPDEAAALVSLMSDLRYRALHALKEQLESPLSTYAAIVSEVGNFLDWSWQRLQDQRARWEHVVRESGLDLQDLVPSEVLQLFEKTEQQVGPLRNISTQQREGLKKLLGEWGGGEPHREEAAASLFDREFERIAGVRSKLQRAAKQRHLAWETYQRNVGDGDARHDPQTEGAEGRAESPPPNGREHDQGVNRPEGGEPSASP